MLHSRFTFAIFWFSIQLATGCGLGRHQKDAPDCETLGTLEERIAECYGACVSLATHPHHCGACGQSCDEKGATDCVNGRCSCVSSNGHRVSDACDPPSVCDAETGLCLTPDPFGEPCDEIEGIICDNPLKVCVDGYCTVPDCDHPETCDLRDNDCDGWLDELPGGGDLTENCYSGPPETVGIGNCSVGSKLCVAGSWALCQGEQLPVTESSLLLCDGQDNDCNNCIDDRVIDGVFVCGVRDRFKKDFTFMIDISVSMEDNLDTTKMAIDGFSSLYAAATNIRWSIERISVEEVVSSTLIDVYHAFSVFPSFQTALASLVINPQGGTEPTYDAVWKTAIGDFDADLGVDPEAIPIYVVFTDEHAYSLPMLGLTEAEVCGAVNARDAILVVFTLPMFYADWDECAILYPLWNDSATMTANLDNLFNSLCDL